MQTAPTLDIGGMERKTTSPNFFTERTHADFLAVSDRTIRNWIKRGERPATSAARRGGSILSMSRTSCSAPGRGSMRRDSPIKRRNPSGKVVWVARYTGRHGRRHIAKPAWNRGKVTFARKAEAQRAIDEAYGLSDRPDTLGDYFRHLDREAPALGADQRDERPSRQPRLPT
jgi:hypothetical protein